MIAKHARPEPDCRPLDSPFVKIDFRAGWCRVVGTDVRSQQPPGRAPRNPSPALITSLQSRLSCLGRHLETPDQPRMLRALSRRVLLRCPGQTPAPPLWPPRQPPPRARSPLRGSFALSPNSSALSFSSSKKPMLRSIPCELPNTSCAGLDQLREVMAMIDRRRPRDDYR